MQKFPKWERYATLPSCSTFKKRQAVFYLLPSSFTVHKVFPFPSKQSQDMLDKYLRALQFAIRAYPSGENDEIPDLRKHSKIATLMKAAKLAKIERSKRFFLFLHIIFYFPCQQLQCLLIIHLCLAFLVACFKIGNAQLCTQFRSEILRDYQSIGYVLQVRIIQGIAKMSPFQ